MLTTVNYNEAIAILKKCYGNKQEIISCHMDGLMALEAVTSHNNTKAHHHLHNKMSQMSEALVLWGLLQIPTVLSGLLSL